MRYFLDTEFNGLAGSLISLALVSETGRACYFATECADPEPWVAQNVMTIIRVPGASPDLIGAGEFGLRIARFLADDPDPVIIADWPDDIRYFCASVITGPGEMANIPSLKFEVRRVDAYPTDVVGAVQHNALWDAIALRHLILAAENAEFTDEATRALK